MAGVDELRCGFFPATLVLSLSWSFLGKAAVLPPALGIRGLICPPLGVPAAVPLGVCPAAPPALEVVDGADEVCASVASSVASTSGAATSIATALRLAIMTGLKTQPCITAVSSWRR